MSNQTPSFDREIEERFVRYALIDTQSDDASTTSPSTDIQFDLLNLLVDELKEIGAADVTLTAVRRGAGDDPGDGQRAMRQRSPSSPTSILLPASMRTGVKPIVHRAYAGGDIVLPDDPSAVISPEQFPYLASKAGDDIVTASGTTLLGADDKAGLAIIMAMARHLLENRDLPHGRIRIAFTPDEEIGRGVHPNLPADLDAAFAYTLDGAELGGDRVRNVLRRSRPGRGSKGFRSTRGRPRTRW